jgi:Holliday junction DNA helicase RuvA
VRPFLKAPGVGKKTAQRIVMELKDKLNEKHIFGGMKESAAAGIEIKNTGGEAVEALMSLGYTYSEASQAVNSLESKPEDVEDVIKLALKKLSKQV